MDKTVDLFIPEDMKGHESDHVKFTKEKSHPISL